MSPRIRSALVFVYHLVQLIHPVTWMLVIAHLLLLVVAGLEVCQPRGRHAPNKDGAAKNRAAAFRPARGKLPHKSDRQLKRFEHQPSSHAAGGDVNTKTRAR